ncbi:MAG: CBS domain-containing protein [Leptospiraceae bacterium]|nr:CBS domain-containing protein [Leptospiraceae bacterium]
MITVREYMTKDPVCVAETDSLLTVCHRMEGDKFRHMPIVNEARQVVGMLSERDLRNLRAALDILREGIESEHGQLAVGEIMSRHVVSTTADTSLAQAAREMNAHRIGALPVVEDDALIGIVTYTDVLKAFIDLQGA